ncbi:peptidoglycan DD-metalloendopeptidase family protein [Rhodobacter ferrooxidans]|uniref:Peptidase M23 n=1 Tax=Rhodobacter ferrooxidans TaxID=371731 RepID=C8RWP8_9RHOB|nr:peptidoglycan DD-metalloendopeptidase family protein [Rhodobacter sp. SW2]EEW26991.1 Peptidase M23 [Rhodobacter sp. SW2]
MDKAGQIAAGLVGQVDLYDALRRASACLSEAEADGLLPSVIAALPATEARRLGAVDAGLLRAVMRVGAGFAAVPGVEGLVQHLAQVPVAPLFLPEIGQSSRMALRADDRQPGMPAFSDRAFDPWFAAQGVDYGLGAYGEVRSIYASAQFADAASPERRTRHIGIDVLAAVGTPVHAPLAGRVAWVTYNADPLDYGHTLILQHEGSGRAFWTLYGHLGGSLPGLCRVGDMVQPGQVLAHLGDWHENGGWAAHLHFQVMSDMLEQRSGNFFGVGHASLWDVWQQICPDPNLLLRLPAGSFAV